MEHNGNQYQNNGHRADALSAARPATIHDYLAMLYRGRWIIVGVFVVMMSAIVYYTLTVAPSYQASTTLMIDEKQGVGQALFPLSSLSGQQTLINNQVEILKSRSLAQAVIDRLLESPYRDSLHVLDGLHVDRTMQDVVKAFQENVDVMPNRHTALIAIKVVAASPFEAEYLTRSVAKAFQEKDQAFSQGEISQVVDFLAEQLKRKESELKASEDALKQFLEKEKIASLNDEATQVVEQSAVFESLYKEALIDQQVTQKRLDFLKSQLGRSKETLEAEIARVSSPLVLNLRQEMAEIERTIAVFLSQGVGERDPQVNAIKNRLTEETRKLIVDGLPADDPLAHAQDLVLQVIEAETEMAAISAKAQGLKRVVDSYTTKLESLPDKHVQLARLERSRKVDENLYMMMREKFEESRITKAGQIGKVRIVDEPVRPRKPISPKKRLNIIFGAIFSLGLGIGITFFREYMDTSVRRVEDIEMLGLTVLAAIPKINTDDMNSKTERNNGKQNGELQEARKRLVTHFKPKSPISESYRTLRTNLKFSDRDRNLHCMLVTSSGPGEGKSTTTANLAIAMSLQGTRTIIVDTDLRRPVGHRIFNVEKNRGLTNVLVGSLKLDDAVQPTAIQNLDILTSGILPPNPAELLGSERMRQLIEMLKSKYDMVLLDTPPLIAVTDAAVLSKEVDGVLLVVSSGRTHRAALSRGSDLLRNVNANILGVVLNGVSRENTYGSYYYYYHNYYYYYSDAGDKTKKKTSRRSRRNGKQEQVTIVS